jgi:pimeloyl-ACP methyl ester carboxylesterase
MPRVTVHGVALNFAQEGEGSDLVLVHGLGGDLHVWDADVPTFARYHRVLRCDVRGFGRSDKPPGPYAPHLFAQDLAEVCRAAEVRSAHVLGISMGGVIAQRFALDFPEWVRSLVLVSTSSEVGGQSIAAWGRLADVVERHGFDARSTDASRAFSPTFARRHPEVVAEASQRTAANDPRGYAAAARAVSDYHWTAELGRIRAPVLILQGLEDQLTPPGGSVKMSRALPRARLLMVEGAGHNVPIEQSAVFRASVLAFIAGVDFGSGMDDQGSPPRRAV